MNEITNSETKKSDVSAMCLRQELNLFLLGIETLGHNVFFKRVSRKLEMSVEEKIALSNLIKKYPILLDSDISIAFKDNCNSALYEDWKHHAILGKSYHRYLEMESKIIAKPIKHSAQDEPV